MFVLGDVIKSVPEIGSFKSSKFVAPLASKVFNINGYNYELRILSFEVPEQKTFAEFVAEYELENIPFKVFDNGYSKLFGFGNSEEMKKEKIYYTLVLRPIDEK